MKAAIHQHRDLGRIPVVGVVRRNLESPGEFARIRIQRDDAAGPGIVAGARRAVQHRRRISGADEHQIQLRIVGAGIPHLSARGAAALRLALAGRRRAIESPLRLARVRIEGPQQAGQIVEVAGDAHDHVISDDQRSVGGPVALARIGDQNVPFDFAVLGVQRDQVAVGRGEIHRVLINRRASVPDVKGVVLGVLVMPEFLAGARVDGPEVIGRRDVDDAVRHDRRGLEPLAGLEAPDLFEPADILGSDLGQLAVPLAGVIAVISEPGVRGGIEQFFRVYVLCADAAGRPRQRNVAIRVGMRMGVLLQSLQVCVDVVHVRVRVFSKLIEMGGQRIVDLHLHGAPLIRLSCPQRDRGR